MADEKIMKTGGIDTLTEDEMLNKEQLDGVAGGGVAELSVVANELHKMGKLNWKDRDMKATNLKTAVINLVNASLNNISKELGIDIQLTYNSNAYNIDEYRIEGEKFSSQEFWAIIKDGLSAN